MKFCGLCLVVLLSSTGTAFTQQNAQTDRAKREKNYARVELRGTLTKTMYFESGTPFWSVQAGHANFSLAFDDNQKKWNLDEYVGKEVEVNGEPRAGGTSIVVFVSSLKLAEPAAEKK